MTPQFLLGVSYQHFQNKLGDDRDCTGDLDAGECYAVSGEQIVDSIGINSIFYFREDGYKKWGFYLSPGLGYSKNKLSGHFSRYDKDPGWLCGIFDGDCKRLRESGSDQTSTADSLYLKLGVGYQFIWTPNLKVSGHILDLGISTTYSSNRNKINIDFGNGSVRRIDTDLLSTKFEISYMIAF